ARLRLDRRRAGRRLGPAPRGVARRRRSLHPPPPARVVELVRLPRRLLAAPAARGGDASGDAQHGLRPRPQAEQRVVERLDELRAIPVQERLDERAANGVASVAAEALRAQCLRKLAPLTALVGEEHRRPHRRRPGSAVAAEQAGDLLAYLRRAEGLLGEERELPAVERLAELTIVVGHGELLAQVGGELRAQLVEARRLAARLARGDGKQWGDAERPEVEPLEDNGAGGDRPGGREPERRHGVCQLGGGVRWLGLVRLELALQLEHEQPVDVAA